MMQHCTPRHVHKHTLALYGIVLYGMVWYGIRCYHMFSGSLQSTEYTRPFLTFINCNKKDSVRRERDSIHVFARLEGQRVRLLSV